MRFHVGGVIADKCVRGCVRFIETIAGKFIDHLKDIFGIGFLDFVGHGSFDEFCLFARHHRFVFFTHRTTQNVSLSERITTHHLGDLNNLLLINNNAVGLG